jgi:SAM-dependent methyltransferase
VTRAAAMVALVAWLAAHLGGEGQTQRQRPHGRLFPPADLGLLEAPDRDIWQRPDQIMDALAIAEASIVADIGAGSGWFTIRLARRVGPNGIVYAQDVQPEALTAVSRRVTAEGLTNVRTVLGVGSDPRLPAARLDAVLIVDAYHEIEDRVTMLRNLARSLRIDGRIGVVDFKLEGGGPGPPTEERVPPETVIGDAERAGLRLLSQETFLPYQYFLIFGHQARAGGPQPPQPKRWGAGTAWGAAGPGVQDPKRERPTNAQAKGSTALASAILARSSSTKG